jgi:hypothetical protein
MTLPLAAGGPRPFPAESRVPPKQVCWVPNAQLGLGQWAEVGRRIGSVGRNIQWLLGDWIVYGNERFGERYARAARMTGYDTQTLMNMVYVATHFPASRRRESLSWSHHEALAAFNPEEQDRWLDRAAQHRWSVSDLRTMLRAARKKARELPAGDEQADCFLPARVLNCPRCGEEISVE